VKQTYNWPDVTPPVADQKPYDTGMHGDVRMDEYYWMADFFSEGPDSDKVVAYLNEENAYKDAMMADTKQFQENLFTEMKGRIKEKDESVPVFKNGYFYYTSSEEGEQ
jgi:oligopeptidase B